MHSNENKNLWNDSETRFSENKAELTRNVEINIIAGYTATRLDLTDISSAVFRFHLRQLQVIFSDSRVGRQRQPFSTPMNRRTFAHLTT